MRLLSCSIEGFGKLHNFKMDFSEELNVFLENNAWGKSTLAAFIRVMFFGFLGETNRSLSDREREKYRPWNKGIYGGTIVFLTKGKEYELQRSFGQRPKDDSAHLYDRSTNLESKDFSVEEIGQELFSIDAQSFLRTVFVAQNDTSVLEDGKSSVGDSISAKIGNLSDATDDINNYEKVMEKLADEMNRLTPKRATGQLKKTEAEIAQKKMTVREGENIKKSLSTLLDKIEEEKTAQKEAEKELEALDEQFVQAGKYREKLTLREQYLNLIEQENDSKSAAGEKEKIFGGIIPKREELENMLTKSRNHDAKLPLLLENELRNEEREQYGRLSLVFASKVPTEEELADCKQTIDIMRNLKDQMLVTKLSASEEERLAAFKQKYPKGLGKADESSFQIAAWNKRSAIKEGLAQKEESIERKSAEFAKKKNAKKLYLGVGVLCLGIAAFLYFMMQNYYALVPAFIGILFIVLSLTTNSSYSSEDIQKEQEALNADREFIKQTQEKVISYLEKYGISCPVDYVEEELYAMKQDYSLYESLSAKERTYNSLGSERKLAEKETAVVAFLHRFYPEKEISEKNAAEILGLLEKESGIYKRLCEKQNRYTMLAKEEEAEQKQLALYLGQFMEWDGKDATACLQNFINELNLYENLKSQEKKNALMALSFSEEHDGEALLSMQITDEMPTQEEIAAKREQLQKQLEEIKETIRKYRTQAENLQEDLQDITDAEEKLEELYEKKAKDTKQYHFVEMTSKYLRQAKENQTARYVAPIKEAFAKYYALLTEETSKDIRVDANLSITRDEAGEQREIRSLSLGLQDLFMVCERMALVDAMYKEEKPFIVLDDPFVNLDAGKLAHARNFLEKIAEEYQVIYFTCHESRM